MSTIIRFYLWGLGKKYALANGFQFSRNKMYDRISEKLSEQYFTMCHCSTINEDRISEAVQQIFHFLGSILNSHALDSNETLKYSFHNFYECWPYKYKLWVVEISLGQKKDKALAPRGEKSFVLAV